jgi:hypothetical protein
MKQSGNRGIQDQSGNELPRPFHPRTYRFAAAVLWLALLVGCRGPRILAVTSDEVKAHGTAIFQAPRDKVARACTEALKAMGYSIAPEESGRGEVFTKTLPARTALSVGNDTSYMRRYEIAIRETPENTVEVMAVPMLSEARLVNGSLSRTGESSPRTAWKLEEERAEWKRLFASIEQHLAREGATGTWPPEERRRQGILEHGAHMAGATEGRQRENEHE